jgi:PPOX class probable F420-dependent enzyme
MPMTKRAIDALLKQPNVAVMAVTTPDGAPHAVPVWYEWKSGAATVFMLPGSFKLKCLRREPRMSLVVDTKKSPYKCVILKGKVTIELKKADAWIRRLSVAYYGQRAGLKYAESLKGMEFALVTLKPDRIVSWDYAQDSDAGG